MHDTYITNGGRSHKTRVREGTRHGPWLATVTTITYTNTNIDFSSKNIDQNFKAI